MELVALNILIPKELASRLAALRKTNGTNVSAFVRLAIEARLNRAVVEAPTTEQTPKIEYRATRVLVAPQPKVEQVEGTEE